MPYTKAKILEGTKLWWGKPICRRLILMDFIDNIINSVSEKKVSDEKKSENILSLNLINLIKISVNNSLSSG